MDRRSDSPVVIAAEQILAELRDLLGADAEETGQRLDELLTAQRSAEGDARRLLEDQVVLLLAAQKPTRGRLAELLDGVTVDAERTMRGFDSQHAYQRPAGGAIVSAFGFACSKDGCGYVWPWIDINQTPPSTCPRDDSPLAPIVRGS